ncbi:hypothetical protein TSAR_015604 [Trichomalopsis sarcophagae]|uniref:Retrotransposon gag domain-containing protein n=1 Tax=Trichomalopsis sarcophagae TaxID=543379 RepID=A0A232F180_9HYME|nr:hypothetical protein TSAR_015604 [Trichomalopsis sarcophagae]
MIEATTKPNLTKLIRWRLQGEARQSITDISFETIEELLIFLKNIYAPTKTVVQLLGEMGNEYQRDGESVITFANRIKDIGNRVIEAHRLENAGTIVEAFRTYTENTLVDCLKRVLKAEIEQRLAVIANEKVNDIVKKLARVLPTERRDGDPNQTVAFQHNERDNKLLEELVPLN